MRDSRRKTQSRRLIRLQQGLIANDQAREMGMSASAIARRVREGEWIRVLPRVYRDASVPVTYRQRLLAALLWVGDGSFVSHRAAVKLWTLDGFEEEVIEVTCARFLKSPEPWVHVHTSSVPGGSGTMQGVRLAPVARTLIDLGGVSISTRSRQHSKARCVAG